MRSVPDFLSLQALHRPQASPASQQRLKTGVAAVDALIGGGMSFGRIHEFYAAQSDDSAATAGFVAAMTIAASGNTGPVVWIRPKKGLRTGGVLQAAGWAELGGAPENLLTIIAEDNSAMLRVAHDALRCRGSGIIVAEAWGRIPELDLTAGRRLSLAAEKSGLALLLIRVDADAAPSAAETRWQVAAAPSRACAANAPGAATFDIDLLRQRGGPAGLHWRLEWNRDRRMFGDTATSGALLPLPLRRPAADAGRGTMRRVA